MDYKDEFYSHATMENTLYLLPHPSEDSQRVHATWDVAKTSARDHCKQRSNMQQQRNEERGLRDFSQFKSSHRRSSEVHVKKKIIISSAALHKLSLHELQLCWFFFSYCLKLYGLNPAMAHCNNGWISSKPLFTQTGALILIFHVVSKQSRFYTRKP